MNLLILGVTSRGSIKTERWVKTLRYVYDGKIVLVLTSNKDRLPYLEEKYNVEILLRPEDDNFWANTSNGIALGRWNKIKEVCYKYFNYYIMVTDVWDVIWQGDPRKYLENINKNKFYLSYEGMINKQNAYMIDWVLYSPHLQKIRDLGYFDYPTFCCGSVLAYAEELEKLSDYIIENKYKIHTDQSIMGCYLLESKKEVEYIPNLMESLADQYKKAKIENGKISDKDSDKLWCCVHANGNTKEILEKLY